MNETNLSVTGLKRVQDEATPLRSSLFDLGDSSENPDEPATESAETEFARYLDNRDRMKFAIFCNFLKTNELYFLA